MWNLFSIAEHEVFTLANVGMEWTSYLTLNISWAKFIVVVLKRINDDLDLYNVLNIGVLPNLHSLTLINQ